MAEKKRKELIDEIMSKNVTEGNDEAYKSFLEALSVEELQSHYDELFNEE